VKLQQACCAQMAPKGGLDGNRYRLSEIDEVSQTGPCGEMRTERGVTRCQAEHRLERCPLPVTYDVAIQQERKVGLCSHHYRVHTMDEEPLWIYLPPYVLTDSQAGA
jgi:hypothetical protein